MTTAAPPASPAPPQVLLAHHLRQLKLPTFLREYEKVAAEAARQGLDHVRFLLRLAELELIDRERRMVERRIRAARFPAVKSFDTFDFAAIPSLNKPLVLELARSFFRCRTALFQPRPDNPPCRSRRRPRQYRELPEKTTSALCVTRLTDAEATLGMAEIAFSTRVTQDAHVMPSMPRLSPAACFEAAGREDIGVFLQSMIRESGNPFRGKIIRNMRAQNMMQ